VHFGGNELLLRGDDLSFVDSFSIHDLACDESTGFVNCARFARVLASVLFAEHVNHGPAWNRRVGMDLMSLRLNILWSSIMGLTASRQVLINELIKIEILCNSISFASVFWLVHCI
jgi:hypothetical protein